MSTFNRRTLLKSAAAGAALAALPRTAFAQAQRRNLVIATPTQPNYADPVMANDTPTLRILYNAFDGLLRIDYNDNMAIKPAIAESWSRIDDKTVEFKLRPGVKFHDGSVVTVDDVLFSLGDERKNGPGGKGQTSAKMFQRTVDKVEAVDSMTVRVTTNVPDPVIEKKLAAWSAQIVSRAAFEKAGSWDAWFQAPVGAGPYRIVSNKKDVGVVLQSHDGYWGGLPPFAGLEFRVVPEPSSRVNGLRAGDYDLITDLLPDQFDDVDAASFDIVGGAINNLRVLAIDTTGDWLKDVRVRQAMSLAIDRQLIIDQLWAGKVSVPNGAQYPLFGDLYEPGFPAPTYDPDKARSLLAEAGYKGEPIPYRLLSNWYPNQVLTAQATAEMWKAVGLNIELHPMENFSQVYAKPSGAIWDESLLPSWPDPTAMVWKQYGPGGGLNVLNIWNSPEYLAIGEKFAQSSDPAERKALQHQSLELLAAQVPFIILHNNGAFFGKRKDVHWAPYSGLSLDFGPLNPATKA